MHRCIETRKWKLEGNKQLIHFGVWHYTGTVLGWGKVGNKMGALMSAGLSIVTRQVQCGSLPLWEKIFQDEMAHHIHRLRCQLLFASDGRNEPPCISFHFCLLIDLFIFAVNKQKLFWQSWRKASAVKEIVCNDAKRWTLWRHYLTWTDRKYWAKKFSFSYVCLFLMMIMIILVRWWWW